MFADYLVLEKVNGFPPAFRIAYVLSWKNFANRSDESSQAMRLPKGDFGRADIA